MDFFFSQSIADRIEEILDNLTSVSTMRAKVRETIEQRYMLKKILSEKVDLLSKIIK